MNGWDELTLGAKAIAIAGMAALAVIVGNCVLGIGPDEFMEMLF